MERNAVAHSSFSIDLQCANTSALRILGDSVHLFYELIYIGESMKKERVIFLRC